jgi:hypothetical protein
MNKAASKFLEKRDFVPLTVPAYLQTNLIAQFV